MLSRVVTPLAAACLLVLMAGQTALSAARLGEQQAPSRAAATVAAPPAPLQKPAAPALRPIPRGPGHLVARVTRSVGISSRPGGPAITRLGARTEFGSRTVVGVAAVRRHWLGVLTSARPNGRLAWVPRGSHALRLYRTRWSIDVDISGRSATLRRAGKARLRLTVAVGRPGSPTPTGRFVVTDKLPGGRFGPYYGCCILALSGYQPHPPPGWRGGNRMAIHGTSSPSTIGQAVSAGCLRAGYSALRRLMRMAPLGARVTIRA